MFKAQDYDSLFTNLYMRADILPTCGTHLHDRLFSLRGRFKPIKLTKPHYSLLKYLYHAREVSCYVYIYYI